jgi:hypothetical protein
MKNVEEAPMIHLMKILSHMLYHLEEYKFIVLQLGFVVKKV